MLYFRKYVLLALIISTIISCKDSAESKNSSIDIPEIEFKKEGELLFISSEKDTLSHIDIEIAESSYEQQTGLMYRKSMQSNQGMLFVYENERPRPNFYMKNTYIPLDLIYISSTNHVVDFNENAEPFNEESLPSDAPAQYVLEVNSGKVSEWELSIGDSVIVND